MADEVGRVLVVSFTPELASLEAIKQIHGNEELPHPVPVSEHLEGFPWTINNKYFKAVVHLCHCSSSSTLSAVKTSLLQNSDDLCFESIIVIFNQEQKESLKDATSWMDYVETLNASVQLLLNAGKEETEDNNEGLSQKEVLEWCLRYSFELVELKPNEEEHQDAGEFGEQTGFPRVIQALNCGEWPNIQLKGNVQSKKSSAASSTIDDKCNALENKHNNSNNDTCCKTDEEKTSRKLMDCSGLTDDESELLQRLGQEDPDGQSFEELFTKLKDMKDHASTLPDEQRKSYAEQVAIAFWKAMGGEDDEISGLDGDGN